MSKKSIGRRVSALKKDPRVYRKDIANTSIDVSRLGDVGYGEQTAISGRIVLSDISGNVSRLGVFDKICNRDVIILERISWNGRSVPAYLKRTEENVDKINSTIHYGDIVMLEGVKLAIDSTDVFLGDSLQLLSKAIGNIYDSNIDFSRECKYFCVNELF